MACYHPINAVQLSKLKANGKKDIKFLGDNRCLHDALIIEKKYGPGAKLIQLPCGRCIGCRLDYAKNWANRMMLEAKKSPDNFFITLTYNEEEVPKRKIYTHDNKHYKGEVLTLRKSDLQKFFKDLRNIYSRNYCFSNSFKYYACGEYGDKTLRPHYHICLFNCKYFDDLEYKYKDSQGFIHYTSTKLDNLWKRGLTEICNFSWHTASYTARYVVKKHFGIDARYYKDAHLDEEFVLMSRRPGIAFDYFQSNFSNIYKYDAIVINNDKSSLSVKPSRYYDKLFDIKDHDAMEKVRNNRELKQVAKNKVLSAFNNTNLTPFELLDVQEKAKERVLTSLPRKEI